MGAIEAQFPELTCSVAEGKPRSGSFEIDFYQAGSTRNYRLIYYCTLWLIIVESVSIWTGLKKGPPRKLKFPEESVIIETLKSALSSSK